MCFNILDVLIVVNDVVGDFYLPGTRQILLEPDKGLLDVGQMAVDQELLFLGVKVLVIITGFAEVEAGHPAMLNCVMAAMMKLRKNVGYDRILLGSPLPRPHASVTQLKSLFALSKSVQDLCKVHPGFEFTKTGLLFYGPGGMYANLMDDKGLTSQGVTVLRRQLIDKLNSLGLVTQR